MSGLNLRMVLATLAHKPEVFDDPYVHLQELRRLEALGYVVRPKTAKAHARPFITATGNTFLKSLVQEVKKVKLAVMYDRGVPAKEEANA
jgi:hypothetical protein